MAIHVRKALIMRTLSKLKIVGVVLLLGLAGCASLEYVYQPNASGGEQPAVVRIYQNNMGVQRVDGLSVLSGVQTPLSRYPSKVMLKPGKHTLLVGSYTDMTKLWLVAKPGREYVLKYNSNLSDSGRFWLEDSRSGETVGGCSGSDDEPKDPVATHK